MFPNVSKTHGLLDVNPPETARLATGEAVSKPRRPAMTTIEHSPFTMPAARPAISTRVVNLLLRAYKAYRNRREIYHLGDMSDTELADIGLRRTDLHVAYSTPFGIDPTERLGIIAEARSEESLARQVS